MDLLKLKREEIQKVGYWSPTDGISITDPTTFYESNTTNITLIVITREVGMDRGNKKNITFSAQICVFSLTLTWQKGLWRIPKKKYFFELKKSGCVYTAIHIVSNSIEKKCYPILWNNVICRSSSTLCHFYWNIYFRFEGVASCYMMMMGFYIIKYYFDKTAAISHHK